jgi:hypothetical protein
MKHAFVRLAVLLALISGPVVPTLASASGNPLIAERWKTRPLVVIAPDARDHTLRSLRQALQKPAYREAFIEREMVLYSIVAGVGSRNDQVLTQPQTDALLQALETNAEGPTRIILIGKDGGKKVEQKGWVDPAELFEVIDAMPMRHK